MSRRDDDLDEEIRAHLAMAKQDRIAGGESPGEAERAARAEFGNEGLVKEVTRSMWGWTAVERMKQDVQYALRTLRRSPGFTAAAIVCLALGIGGNTATFSLADALLLRPLPIRNPSEIVTINTGTPQNALDGLAYPEFLDISRRTRSFEHVMAYRLRQFAIGRPADPVPRMKMGMLVSRDFFGTLGVEPVLGRAFTDDESGVPGGDPVAILSHDYWRSDFGQNPGVIGKVVRLNGVAFTIVGVAPENFTVITAMRPAMYVPLVMLDRLSLLPSGSALERRQDRGLSVKARLRGGVSKQQAGAEVATLAKALEHAFPETNRDRAITVRSEFESRMQQSPPLVVLVAMLMTLTGLVLVIACANLANLLLARARSRRREIAVRLAIGASRRRLLQQLLTETMILCLCGGAAGIVLAHAAIRYLASIQIPTDTPLVIAVQLDTRVLAFSLLASLLSAILAGLAPAWHSLKPEVSFTLKTGDVETGSRRMMGRNALVAVQMALAMVLLITCGVFFDAFRRMLVTDPGIRTDHVMMMEFDPALVRYTPEQSREFYRQLLERTRTLAGVRSATLARAIPFRPNFTEEAVVPEGYEFPRGQRSVMVAANVVDEEYFGTMKTAIVLGRGFTREDTASSRRTALINEEFAKRYWPGQNAIGKRFHIGENNTHIEVVGVARTAKYTSLMEAPVPYFYLPLSQNPRTRMTLLVETGDEPAAITGALLQTVRSLDQNQPVYNVRPLDHYFEQGVLFPALVILQMVGSAGMVGLVLAAVGLYGLIAYSVSRRTREIGIRMAIGANRGRILTLILRQGFLPCGIGVALGLGFSVPMFTMMAAALAGLGRLSPWTLVIAPFALIVVAISACYIPALRASRIDPNLALRYE
jgi:predicted permease